MLLIVVATALTVYGIETNKSLKHASIASVLQQHLPFTVLKRSVLVVYHFPHSVATALTVYGIETNN